MFTKTYILSYMVFNRFTFLKPLFSYIDDNACIKVSQVQILRQCLVKLPNHNNYIKSYKPQILIQWIRVMN